MPYMQRCVLVSLAVWLGSAHALFATEVEATSKIDTVIVYPDGATITRVMRVDLAKGDATILARDFPTTLDPSSLRVAGSASVRLVVGSIDARLPRPQPAARPELEQRFETLRDERAALDDQIAAATARRRFAERFAQQVPLGLGEKAMRGRSRIGARPSMPSARRSRRSMPRSAPPNCASAPSTASLRASRRR